MVLDRIVIGMDFSPAAIATAKWVATTLAPRARLVLAHAVERPARPSFLVAETLPADVLEADAIAQAEYRLCEVATSIRDSGVEIDVRIGRADAVVAGVATEIAADLIVVGPHGNRDHESMLLGTTADSLVRSAPAPVLVGPRALPRQSGRVVAAIEDALVTPQVFAWADLLATHLSTRITLLHVLDDPSYSHMASLAAAHARGNAAVEHDEVNEQLQSQAMHWLGACAEAGVSPSIVDAEVQHGQAAEAILQVAKREGAAVIVLGRHGASRGIPALLGRTVRHVLHGARCAVVVVPPAENAADES